ncbi:MAG: hypothetical protein ABIN35_00555 [candidate division WOR-3 bacterium]
MEHSITTFDDIDVGSIDFLCQQLANKGDYLTLRNLVLTNRKIHDICQRYANQAREKYEHRRRKILKRLKEQPDEEKNIEYRLYLDQPISDADDIVALTDKLVGKLRKSSPLFKKIDLRAKTDEMGRIYFIILNDPNLDLYREYHNNGFDQIGQYSFQIIPYYQDVALS